MITLRLTMRAYVASGIVCIASVMIIASYLFPIIAQSAGATRILTGYGWSETIGWISFNCLTTSSCGSVDYGMTADPTSGLISGYAWSDNIGWISANAADLSGCPSAPCSASLSPVNGQMSGWLKALSGGSVESGGWDGFISLSGSGYGPTMLSNNTFSGYSWGSTNVGWVDVSYASAIIPYCAPTADTCLDSNTKRHVNNDCSVTDTVCPYAAYGYGCSAGNCQTPPQLTGTFTVTPQLVRLGSTVSLAWNVSSATTCSVTGTNGDSWQNVGNSGTRTSQPITIVTSFSIHCVSSIPGYVFDRRIDVGVAPRFQEL